MIFQEPMTSLNPVYTVGEQIAEVRAPARGPVAQGRDGHARSRCCGWCASPRPSGACNDYPHQFSGGMRQRVMIAMALACNPKLLIADEPTTALDVTIQAQILDLLAELKAELGMAVMLITHALGVVAEMAQRVVVMYAGKVVEEAPVGELFAHPRHPYTQGLLRSIPRIDTAAHAEGAPGGDPRHGAEADRAAPGCRFAPRCRYASAGLHRAPRRRCARSGPGHKVACILDEVPA